MTDASPPAEHDPLYGLPRYFTIPIPANCYEWYEEMLALHPVYFDPVRDAWLVFRHEDIQRIFHDSQTFSSQTIMMDEGLPSLIMMDPPDHRKMRSLVSRAFTPRAIAQLETRITEIVNDLLDLVVEKGQMDIIEDLAFPLPATVIAEMLGVQAEDKELFRQWVSMIIGIDPQGARRGSEAVVDYCKPILEQRRREPREDLISALLAAEIDGEHLSDEEILGFCLILVIGGQETTTSLLGSTMVCLTDHPEALQAIIAEPALVPDAIEEVLRYRSPAHMISRIVTTDTVLGGQEIKAGQYVLLVVAAANLDEALFPDATTFDIHRPASRHIAFGAGAHFCLGAPLSRLESTIALQIMLERLPHIQRIKTVPLEIKTSQTLYALKHVPIRFG
jgi:cytochrome P450